MSVSGSLYFLRPSLMRAGRKAIPTSPAYAQFYDAVRKYSKETARPGGLDQMKRVQESISDYIAPDSRSQESSQVSEKEVVSQREDVKKRIKELELVEAMTYPRSTGLQGGSVLTCEQFKDDFEILGPNETVILRGRVYSARSAGSKLVFLDIIQDGHKVQALCNLGKLQASSSSLASDFKRFGRIVKRGDIIEIEGTAYTSERGESSIRATQLPTILTPALASLPTTLDDRETLIKNRHADLLVNRKVSDTIKLRSHVFQSIRNFLVEDDFLEVQTPILARSAGGAVARPFETFASEFPDKSLSLRIAPEIWLKRLIIGGMDRVFEIGPVFRNEGIDGTHNPEFYTCEFYKAFANLEDLMQMTEKMIARLVAHINDQVSSNLTSLTPLDPALFDSPFNRIEFIPAIESAISTKLPDLSSPNAQADLIALFTQLSLPLPASPTLPRLLDKLSSTYLEPLCTTPTFITHHPSILAPLAKSFTCPTTNQLISARAELFISSREIANMYEEENSPLEQKRKFIEQKQWIDTLGEERGEVDENYVEAMEWGLPPTGGWGMGLDRVVMLLAGRERIADVMSFGSLRNVVGLGRS